MLQFITGLEKVAASSPYVGNNRFGSFAPIRLNVAAQWLVDGVSAFFDSNIPFSSLISAFTCLLYYSVITFGISLEPCSLRKRPFTSTIGGFLLVTFFPSCLNLATLIG
jgi:hypothetical protein